MKRCENCGVRLEDDPTATLCPGCAYRRKKLAQREAAEGRPPADTPPVPKPPPDMDALRERLRNVEETLRQPSPE